MSFPDAQPFTARRSLVFAGIQIAMAAAMLVLAAAAFLHRYEAGEPLFAVGFLVVLMAGYSLITANQLRDRSPLLIIDAAGLALPGASAGPIAWDRVQALEYRTGFGGARLEVAIDPATFARMKLGRRFLGDHVVNRRGWPTGFAILTAMLDRNGRAIYAAARNYWPPRDEDDDDA